MQQKTMFDIEEPPEKPEPVDPHVRDEDKTRLSKQCELLRGLLLEDGSFKNTDIWDNHHIRRLSARIHDLKNKCGMNIESVPLGGGVWEYRLKEQ